MINTIDKGTEKWLIFINGETIRYLYKISDSCTTYSDFWTCEEFTTEQDWLDRLTELGITIE